MLLATIALCGIGLPASSFTLAPSMLPEECTVHAVAPPAAAEPPKPAPAPAQLVPLNRGTEDGAGYCLRYAQSFFGAPAAHRSAWLAWEATEQRFDRSVPLPGVPVVLWFEHWGTYYDEGGQYGADPMNPYTGNWGHVAAYVPGEGIYSSPKEGYGYEVLPSIAVTEERFEAHYVGWSLDLNTQQVATLGK